MKIRTFFNYIIFLLFCFVLSAQAGEIVLSGIVQDSQTRKPLEGADVYLISGSCGTITNGDGQFILTCKNTYPDDSLKISYLGYRDYIVALNKFQNKSTIFLYSRSLNLGDEIVVSAERDNIIKYDIPQAQRTIQFKEIQRYGSSEISDILKPIPAVRIEGNDLDGRRIQIRGSNADEVNVYLDGILINNMRFDNAADLSIVPVENIESLQILKGGNSAFLGNGAFGGVVNITTRQSTEPGFFLKGKIGSFESRYLIGSINIPITDRFIVSYFGQGNNLTPTIEYFPSEQYSEKTTNDNISTAKQNHSLNLNYFTKSGQFSTRFMTYFFDYSKPNWQSNYKNYLGTASYTGDILGAKDFIIHLSNIYSDDEIQRIPDDNTQYINRYQTNQLNLNIAKKFKYRASELQFMTEYYHNDLRTGQRMEDVDFENVLSHEFMYDNRVSAASVVSFSDYLKSLPILSWKTFVGLRADFLASGDQDLTQMIGAQVEYNMERWRFAPYINYGKNVKYPTLQENAYFQDVSNSLVNDSASAATSSDGRLKPEYNNSAELGVKIQYYPKTWMLRNIEYSLDLFTRTVYNKLITRPFDDVIANFQVGRDVTSGIETSLLLNDIFQQLSLSASFIQLDVGDPLLYAYKPKKNLSLHASYVTPFGLYLTTTYFYEGKSLAWFYDTQINLTTEQIDPYNDMDVTAGVNVPVKGTTLSLQFSGYNIFDNSGFKYYYLKKKYLQVSLSVRY